MKQILHAFILASLVLFTATKAQSQLAGDLDLSFSTDGTVVTDFLESNDNGTCTAVQPDGKILVGGYVYNGDNFDFGLVRYNSDGSIDNTFSVDGSLSQDITTHDDRATAIVIQPDGKILLAGYGSNSDENDFVIVRFENDGSIDNSFSDDGIVITDIDMYNDYAYAIALQPDGKIILGGATDNDNNYLVAIIRYTEDGIIDSTFDSDGIALVDVVPGFESTCTSLAIQSDNKIIAGGYANNGSYDFAVVRLNTDGSLDNSFSTDGFVTTDFASAHEFGNGVALQTDGKIVLAGYTTSTGTGIDFAVARYNTNGTLDNTFDTDGLVVTPVGALQDYGSAVAIQSDGKILVAGSATDTAYADFALVCYNTNGSLNTAFSTDGKAITPIESQQDFAGAIALQPDGKIIVAGYAGNSSDDDFAVARFIPDITVGIVDVESFITKTFVYPNPVSEQILTLQYELDNSQNVSIQLFTIDGKLISNTTTNELLDSGKHSVTLPVTELSEGIYFIRISTDAGNANIQFTKFN